MCGREWQHVSVDEHENMAPISRCLRGARDGGGEELFYGVREVRPTFPPRLRRHAGGAAEAWRDISRTGVALWALLAELAPFSYIADIGCSRFCGRRCSNVYSAKVDQDARARRPR